MLMNKYIKMKPFGKQIAFAMLPHMEALYGGQAGGGKSETLLGIALQYVHVPGYAAIVFRKTLTDLKQPQALIDRSFRWLSNTDAKYAGDEHCWYFPTRNPDGSPGHPSRLQFGYIGEADAHTRYQSAEYQCILWDELTQHEEFNYLYMFSRLRKVVCPIHQLDDKGKPIYYNDCPYCRMFSQVPLIVRSATNPGGRGHEWVRERFDIKPADGRDPYNIAEDDTTVHWVGGMPNERPFISASYKDNPFIDQEQYGKALDHLTPVERARLKHGNWAVNPDSRFKRAWAKYYEWNGDYFTLAGKPYHWQKDMQRIFLTVDPAASLREGMAESVIKKNGSPSCTVISAWGLTNDYNLLFLDMDRFQDEVPEVVNRILKMYAKWKPLYAKIEANGAGKGVFQYAAVYGLNVREIKKSSDKIVNSTTAQVRMSQGRIWFPRYASWVKEATDEIFNWTGDPGQYDDIIDTLSDAANDIFWDAGGDLPLLPGDNQHQIIEYPKFIPFHF